tara:strand:+ start:319 stop:1263 length:945 start_codon:yes stop_codon:yes gene_type:complete
MISFIVVGKNEGNYIDNCLKSIFKAIKKNYYINYEVIYIDSNSKDNSINKALNFKNVKVHKLISNENAANARNLGAEISKGDTLFFIDADMEIISDTLKIIYDKNKGLEYPFISGNFKDKIKTNNGYIFKDYYNLNKDSFDFITGGLFLIKRDLWLKVSGMRSIFRRSQDLDLGLRLSKKGFPLLRKKEILAIHNTIDYNNPKRYISDLINGNFLYQGLLYKNNILNKYVYKKYIYKELTFFTLILSTFFSLYISSNFLLIYFMSILLKIFYKNQLLKSYFYFFSYIIHDIFLIISILFFWPKKIKINSILIKE